MRPEYSNLFRLAANKEANELYVTFEIVRPAILRDEGEIRVEGAVTEEIASFVMNIACAKNLADEIYRVLNLTHKEGE